MPKLSAKDTLLRLHEEESFLLDALENHPEMTLSVKEIRQRIASLSSMAEINEEALKKRTQRLISRLEETGQILRLDRDYRETTEDPGRRTCHIRRVVERTSFMQMAATLESHGESQAAIAVTLSLASRTLEKQLPSQYYNKLKPIFNYADDIINKIRARSQSSGFQSRDAAALVDAIHITQKGIQLRPSPEVQSASNKIIHHLHDAIAQHRTISFHYSGKRRKEPTEYECGPLGIVFRAHKVYLIGTKVGKSDKTSPLVRAWSLDRISELKITRFQFSRPDYFNLVDYVEHESNLESVWNPAKPDPVEISFRVLPKPIPGHGEGLVTEEFMEMRLEGQKHSPKINRDKSLTVLVKRKDTIEFRRWLLGYGDAIAEVKGLPGWKE